VKSQNKCYNCIVILNFGGNRVGDPADRYKIFVVDRSNYQITKTVDHSGEDNYIRSIKRLGKYLVVCSQDNQKESGDYGLVRIYDVDNFDMFATIQMGSRCHAMDAYNNYIFAYGSDDYRIQIHDIRAVVNGEPSLVKSINRVYPTNKSCKTLTFNPHTAQLYIACDNYQQVIYTLDLP